MLHLLLTDRIAQSHAQDILRITGPACGLVVLEDANVPTPQALARVDAAFLSTDLMGVSNKSHPNARLQAFSRAVAGAPALRWIHTCSAGADREVLQQSMGRGVVVTTSSGANAQAVAHTAIAGMLALARGVPHWVNTQAARRWSTQRDAQAPPDIDGGHALVVGMGPVGEAIARICKAMGLRVSGVTRRAHARDGFDGVFSFAQCHGMLGTVDWVFLACPLTPVTRDLVDATFIARLPRTARLVNVSRGEVVVEAALHQALRDGRIAGCYSDVFVEEPLPPDSAWWTVPNTLVSAHSAGASTGFPRRTVQAFLGNLARYVRAEPLAHVAALA